MRVCLFVFSPTVLRSILQITLTTAFHQTLQLLWALLLLSQVLYLKPVLSWDRCVRTISLLYSLVWRVETPSLQKLKTEYFRTEQWKGLSFPLPYESTAIPIQNFSQKLDVFRVHRHMENFLIFS